MLRPWTIVARIVRGSATLDVKNATDDATIVTITYADTLDTSGGIIPGWWAAYESGWIKFYCVVIDGIKYWALEDHESGVDYEPVGDCCGRYYFTGLLDPFNDSYIDGPRCSTCPIDFDCGVTMHGVAMTKYASGADAPSCHGDKISDLYPECLFEVWYAEIDGDGWYLWLDEYDAVHLTHCHTTNDDNSAPCEDAFLPDPPGSPTQWKSTTMLGEGLVVVIC